MAALTWVHRMAPSCRESGALTFLLTTLVLAATFWGCATTSKADPTAQPDVGVYLGLRDTQEAPEMLAIRREIHLLSIGEYRRTKGWPKGANACVEDPGHEDCARWRAFAGALLGMANRMPQDRFVQGQAVFSMVRGKARDLGQMVVEGCQATGWWCRVLQGFVLA